MYPLPVRLAKILAFVFLLGIGCLLTQPSDALGTTIRTEALTIDSATPATDELEAEGWKWEPNADGTSGTLTFKMPTSRCSPAHRILTTR